MKLSLQFSVCCK